MDIALEVHALRTELTNLIKSISPWIGMEEMRQRYGGVTTHTLLAMERRGEIPTRNNGRWDRNQVVMFETKGV